MKNIKIKGKRIGILPRILNTMWKNALNGCVEINNIIFKYRFYD